MMPDHTLRKAVQAVAKAAGVVGKGGQGKTVCPHCATALHWSRSRSGRSVWLCCETRGCIYAHFQTKPKNAWPGLEWLEAVGNA